MRPRIALLSVLCFACGSPPATSLDAAVPRRFHENLPRSLFNGLWLAADAGRPIGVIIYELPDGPRWSPHGLIVESARVYSTHDCRDFRVDADGGPVAAAIGIVAAGSVEDAGVSGATLRWELTPGWRDTLAWGFSANPSNQSTLPQDARVAPSSLSVEITRQVATLDARFEVVWQATPVDGGVPSVIRRDVQQLQLTRALRCE